MRFTVASAALALATVASAVTIPVTVGQNGLSFTPSSVNASAGDQIEFVFYPKNHTVTQSTFANPCQAMSNGTDSGFMPTNSTSGSQQPGVIVTINSTDPVWFYCRQATHCTQGMVFAVNPTANKTFAAFQAAANASGSSSSGGNSSTPSTSGSGSGSAASSAPSSSSTGKNGAIIVGVRAGGLLAAVGLVAGLLL